MRTKKPHPADLFAGQQARSRRLELGLSQTRVAKAIGLTFQQIQKYEKGMNRMGSSRLQQMAELLNVPVTYFFNSPRTGPRPSTNEKVSVSDLDTFFASSEGRALAKALVRIREEKLRRAIANLIEDLASKGA